MSEKMTWCQDNSIRRPHSLRLMTGTRRQPPPVPLASCVAIGLSPRQGHGSRGGLQLCPPESRRLGMAVSVAGLELPASPMGWLGVCSDSSWGHGKMSWSGLRTVVLENPASLWMCLPQGGEQGSCLHCCVGTGANGASPSP